MTIIYRLIGINLNPGTKTELNHDVELRSINLSKVIEFFKKFQLTNELESIKFITDSETMREEKEYEVKKEERVIFVFTSSKEIKIKLSEIFRINGYIQKKRSESKTSVKSDPDPEIIKPIPFDQIKFDEETIKESNVETIKLFNNDDFIELLRIFSSNPDIFKKFSSYISSGDVIIDSERFLKKEKVDMTENLNYIKSLNLKNMTDEKIMTALNKFNGHLNLSLRYLLCSDAFMM